MKFNSTWIALFWLRAYLIDFQDKPIPRGRVCRKRVLLAILSILTVIYLAQAVVINIGG